MSELPPLAVVDIDGVVADVRHRLPFIEGRVKDWEGFFGAAGLDTPHEEGLALVERLAEDHDVVFLTGRPIRIRRETQRWLDRHGLGGHRLVMRPDNERRPAARMKVRLLQGLAKGRTVGLVVDDDRAVLKAMREAGYPTFHADWEDRSVTGQAALFDAQEGDGRT
ncbi:MAG: phosphatase domain-containing protein [Sporichthyaceae bacterium]